MLCVSISCLKLILPYRNQRNVANNSGVALQELIGWDHGQHGNVIYSVDVAWMKQDGNIAHHQ